MQVVDHRLCRDNGIPYVYVPSPHRWGLIEHKFLLMHYSAGGTPLAVVDWFQNPNSKVSAHLIIGRDRSIVQTVPFNVRAWHAGESSWNDLEGLNRYSIGIELDNAGRLEPAHANQWRSWWGRLYGAPNEVLVAAHKNEEEISGWHRYTPDQIETAVEVARTLIQHYGLTEILGHDDVSPGRKSDPGPAFPMEDFRARARAPYPLDPMTPLGTYIVIVYDAMDHEVDRRTGVRAFTRRDAYHSLLGELAFHKTWDAIRLCETLRCPNCDSPNFYAARQAWEADWVETSCRCFDCNLRLRGRIPCEEATTAEDAWRQLIYP